MLVLRVVLSNAGPVLHAAGLLALGLAYWLLPKYLEQRVSEAARGAVDVSVGRALADHRHALDKQLEDHRSALAAQADAARDSALLEQERFSRDYALFAERRNHIYADTYAKFEEARGAFAAQLGTPTMRRDFRQSLEPDIRDAAPRLELVTPAERYELYELLNCGDIRAAGELATRLYVSEGLRPAIREYQEYRNGTVIHSLYFSPEIEAVLEQAAAALVPLVTFAEEMQGGRGTPA